jgi:hypothetical protein
MFLLFTPSVGVNHFYGGSKWKGMLLRTSSVEVANLSGVYVILILRVRSLTILNVNISSNKISAGFLS